MKIAVVHDFLCSKGGSERVFQYICESFPEADVYTLAYNAKNTFPYFLEKQIRTTWLQPFVRSSEAFRWLFLLGSQVMKNADFSAYDLVISSSASTAKYLTASRGLHICYCYMPTRALWHFESYFGQSWKAKILKYLLPYLKKRDYNAAQNIDHFLTISKSSQNYIKEYYNRDSEIIYSPIDLSKLDFSTKKGEHYLLVSRLEHWKRVDYAVRAFNDLGLPLKIIGAGNEGQKLKELAKENITFLGEVDDRTLAREYSECKAVIFTPFLEYGLIPLEANASGTPVIAYGYGGIEETMLNKTTALFFYEQTADALASCVKEFEKLHFDPKILREHALKWDSSVFVKDFRAKVLSLVELRNQSCSQEKPLPT